MTPLWTLLRSNNGAAAVEMALVLPLLLILMFGSVELGNYFLDEHVLEKAVRDGSRFAARYPFSYFVACSGNPAAPAGDPRDPVAETINVVRAGLRSGGTGRLSKVDTTTVTLTTSCTTTITPDGGAAMNVGGIYNGMSAGAPTITVTATVPYLPVVQSFGFTGAGYTLRATSQSAVMGA